MKKLLHKITFYFLPITFCFYLFLTQFFVINISTVFAQTCGADTGVFCPPLPGVLTLKDAIIIIIRYLLSIIGIITLAFIIISGIKYIISGGNEEKMKSAKEALYSSALGLTLALMAYGILEVIVTILNS